MPHEYPRLINAFLRKPVDCTPIWIMRQAGRYLPEYRALRQKAGDFLTLCKTPELACEVTLQPLRRFPLDGAILFSDILTIPDAMGLGLHFVENEGPQFKQSINSYSDIARLNIPDPHEKLSYVLDTIRLVKSAEKNTPLIGFAGSPWTLSTYMIEGGSSREFHRIKKMLYQNPEALHLLLEKLAKSTIAYLNAQIESGVDAVMIFDTWGGILTTSAYQEFSLAYMQQILSGLKRQQGDKVIPAILFTKFSGLWLEKIAESGCEVVGLDWTIDLGQARKRIGDAVALQGNLDPAILLTTPEVIRAEVKKILDDFGPYPGHVFNLGHGIPKEVPYENVAVLVETVHELSRRHD